MLRKMTEENIKEGLKFVIHKIEEACKKRIPELQALEPQLVAVSKTKPVNLIIAAYEEGQRHFGENYVLELEEKANNPLILESCKDIKWHFIGHLQSNKVNKVLCLPNIYLIETVDSKKLATTLNKNWPKFRPCDTKLRIMVQVNTSGEGGRRFKELVLRQRSTRKSPPEHADPHVPAKRRELIPRENDGLEARKTWTFLETAAKAFYSL